LANVWATKGRGKTLNKFKKRRYGFSVTRVFVARVMLGLVLICLASASSILALERPTKTQTAGSGTTYYVNAAGGKDSNDGLSPTKAWKTIDRINKSAFLPGDSILFKRGQTWREQLIVPSSGMSGLPIRFGAYGTGLKPRINGSDILTSWSRRMGTTYVKSSVTTEPKIVVYNGTRLTKGAGIALVRKAYYYDRGGAALYVNVGENPATHKLEAAVRDYCIRNSHHDYINFADLDIRNTNIAGFYIQDSDHLDLDACDITQVACRGTLVTNAMGSSETSQYLSFRNMKVSHSGGTGISVDGDADTTGHVLIQNCVVHDCGWNADPEDAVRWTAGIKAWGGANYGTAGESDNIIIEKCEVYNQADTHGDYSGAGIWVDQWGAGAVVRWNRIHNNATYGILLENMNSSALVHNNLVYSNTWGIAVYRNIKNQKIFNNSLYDNSDIGLWCKGGESPGVDFMNNNEFKNNIVIGSSRALSAIRGGDNSGHGYGNVYEYNCLGPEATNFVEWGNGIYKSTYKTWETSYGSTTHSVEADPLFVSTSNPLNFRLRKISPCLSKGFLVNVFIDLDGNPIPTRPGKNPDLGAYESK
jgi:parallel beta-helix repeat protein